MKATVPSACGVAQRGVHLPVETADMVDGVAGLRVDNPGGQKGGNDEQERE
ncbi:MAG: hypothetical protein R2854_08115 [Caldilineaceae bacterium]